MHVCKWKVRNTCLWWWLRSKFPIVRLAKLWANCSSLVQSLSLFSIFFVRIFLRGKKPAHKPRLLGITKLGFVCLIPVMAHSNLHQERLAKKKKKGTAHILVRVPGNSANPTRNWIVKLRQVKDEGSKNYQGLIAARVLWKR